MPYPALDQSFSLGLGLGIAVDTSLERVQREDDAAGVRAADDLYADAAAADTLATGGVRGGVPSAAWPPRATAPHAASGPATDTVPQKRGTERALPGARTTKLPFRRVRIEEEAVAMADTPGDTHGGRAPPAAVRWAEPYSDGASPVSAPRAAPPPPAGLPSLATVDYLVIDDVLEQYSPEDTGASGDADESRAAPPISHAWSAAGELGDVDRSDRAQNGADGRGGGAGDAQGLAPPCIPTAAAHEPAPPPHADSPAALHDDQSMSIDEPETREWRAPAASERAAHAAEPESSGVENLVDALLDDDVLAIPASEDQERLDDDLAMLAETDGAALLRRADAADAEAAPPRIVAQGAGTAAPRGDLPTLPSWSPITFDGLGLGDEAPPSAREVPLRTSRPHISRDSIMARMQQRRRGADDAVPGAATPRDARGAAGPIPGASASVPAPAPVVEAMVEHALDATAENRAAPTPAPVRVGRPVELGHDGVPLIRLRGTPAQGGAGMATPGMDAEECASGLSRPPAPPAVQSRPASRATVPPDYSPHSPPPSSDAGTASTQFHSPLADGAGNAAPGAPAPAGPAVGSAPRARAADAPLDDGSAFGNLMERELARICRESQQKYRVHERPAPRSAPTRDEGTQERPWSRVQQQQSDVTYSPDMGAEEANALTTGRVFLLVDSFVPEHIPLPKEHTDFFCVLDNGIHMVKTAAAALHPQDDGTCPIVQEFELVEHAGLEISLSLMLQLDTLAQGSDAENEIPPDAGGLPPHTHAQRSAVGRLLHPRRAARSTARDSTVGLPSSAAKRFLHRASGRAPPLLSFLNSQGVLGRAVVNFREVQSRCYASAVVVDVPVKAVGDGRAFRGSTAAGTRDSFLQHPGKARGLLRLRMFYLPPLPRRFQEELPRNLDECVQGMDSVNWHQSGSSYKGILTQLGGDCTTWRRRPVRVMGLTMIGFNEVTKRPTIRIDLVQALDVQRCDPGAPENDDLDEMYHVSRSFRLSFRDGEKIYFFADTDAEVGEWVRVLSGIIAHKQPSPPAWAEAAASSLAEAQGVPRRAPAPPAVQTATVRTHVADDGSDAPGARLPHAAQWSQTPRRTRPAAHAAPGARGAERAHRAAPATADAAAHGGRPDSRPVLQEMQATADTPPLPERPSSPSALKGAFARGARHLFGRSTGDARPAERRAERCEEPCKEQIASRAPPMALPLEVLLDVLLHCATLDQTTAVRLLALNSTLRERLHPFVYARVELCTSRALAHFTALVQARADIARAVRSLWIGPRNADSDLITILSTPDAGDSIYLEDVRHRAYANTRHVLRACRGLQDVALNGSLVSAEAVHSYGTACQPRRVTSINPHSFISAFDAPIFRRVEELVVCDINLSQSEADAILRMPGAWRWRPSDETALRHFAYTIPKDYGDMRRDVRVLRTLVFGGDAALEDEFAGLSVERRAPLALTVRGVKGRAQSIVTGLETAYAVPAEPTRERVASGGLPVLLAAMPDFAYATTMRARCAAPRAVLAHVELPLEFVESWEVLRDLIFNAQGVYSRQALGEDVGSWADPALALQTLQREWRARSGAGGVHLCNGG
ncbi:Bud site selection protein bud4 [Malassezia sp. CBS 17886]|nr:Bud site selection protein bud4 [Malassezia sp. CBS 17886]